MVWIEVLVFLHLVSMAFGVSAATIANLMVRLEREPWLSFLRLHKGPWFPSTLFPRLTRLVLVATVLLLVSGIALSYLLADKLNLFILGIKLLVGSVVIVNGIHLALHLEPEVEKSVPPQGEETPEFKDLMSKLRAHSLVSLAGWYLIVALSVLLR